MKRQQWLRRKTTVGERFNWSNYPTSYFETPFCWWVYSLWRYGEASVKDIVDVVRGVGAGDESDSELKKEVSISNAIECITTLVDFINQNDSEIDASCVYSLNKLKKEIVLEN